MRTGFPTLILASFCAAAPLAGQSNVIDYHKIFRVRPQSCAMADSLAGRPLGRAKEYSFGWAEGEQGQVVSNGVWEISASRPLDAILITASYHGLVPGTPHPDAIFAIQIRMKDTVLRQGADAELTLIIDSTEVEVGDMLAEPTALSRERRVDQMLTQALRPSTVRRIAASTSLRGRLGQTPFTVPPKTLERMRSAFIAATCGAKIE